MDTKKTQEQNPMTKRALITGITGMVGSHLAAQSYPKTSFTSPIHTLDTNILGTLRLLESLRGCQDIDPVIHVCSSSEVFGRVPRERLPINEDCPFHPASPHAISKIGTDLVGRFHAEACGQKAVN